MSARRFPSPSRSTHFGDVSEANGRETPHIFAWTTWTETLWPRGIMRPRDWARPKGQMRLACFTLDHITGFTDLRPTINSVPNFPFTSWRSNQYSTFLYSFDSARSLSFCLVHRGHSSSYDHGIVDTEFNEFVYRSCKISRKRCQRWQPEEKKKRKTRLKVTYVK